MSNPKYIIATRSVKYDVEKVVKDLQEVGEEGEVITLEDVMYAIQIWATDDLSCGYGHVIDVDSIEFEEVV